METELTLVDVFGSRENKGIMPMFFGTQEANQLRLVSKDMKQAVEWYPWEDMETEIENLAKWKKCFPYARSADVAEVLDLKNEDLSELKGVPNVSIMNPTLEDKHFVNFTGIKKLNIDWCNQSTITDKAFESLKGIHTLSMGGCNQSTITDKAFESLVGISNLTIGDCVQLTDKSFEYLAGIQKLDMTGCSQITDEGLKHLAGIDSLVIIDCEQLSKVVVDKVAKFVVRDY